MRDLATSPTVAAPSGGPLAGRVLANRYELVLLLGEGGMGAVYRAHDRELDEVVALKLLRPEIAADAASLVRFRREVKLARRVTHRNVARTFDLGVDGDVHFLTMELIAGASVATIDAQPGAASWKRAAGLMRAVAAGESFAEATEVFAILTDPRSAPRHRARMQAIATECFALAGSAEAAFTSLGALAELPFVDLLWMDRCPPLERLRADPRFAEARAIVAARAAELWS